jgi:PQQ-like domain
MRELYVIGGQQRYSRPLRGRSKGWYKYQKGLIFRIDPDTEDLSLCVEYVSPPEVCPEEEPAILFKSGTIVGDRLYVCTQTEVLIYSLPDFEVVNYISLPSFNDVHHVRPLGNGNLLVAISGLDMVSEMTTSGEVVAEWDVCGDELWTRFSRDVDYRRVSSTKPHKAHPNHLFGIGDERWVTRFEQRDVACVTDLSKRVEIGVERVHDGLVHEGLVYVTTVNGHVAAVDAGSLQVAEVYDLNKMQPGNDLLGWCRSLAVEEGRRVWVGFSRLRPTAARDNVAWVKQGFRRMLGTRIALYDLDERSLVKEIDLEEHGLNAVFGIFPGVGEELGGKETDAARLEASPV